MARAVLPAAAADCSSIGEAIQLLQAAQSHSAGLDAMQLAIRSGSSAMVYLLCQWAESGSAHWAVAPVVPIEDKAHAVTLQGGGVKAVRELCRLHATPVAARDLSTPSTAIC